MVHSWKQPLFIGYSDRHCQSFPLPLQNTIVCMREYNKKISMITKGVAEILDRRGVDIIDICKGIFVKPTC